MILDKLPTGFFSAEEIIKLLKKHTAKNPIVDIEQMVNDIDFM